LAMRRRWRNARRTPARSMDVTPNGWSGVPVPPSVARGLRNGTDAATVRLPTSVDDRATISEKQWRRWRALTNRAPCMVNTPGGVISPGAQPSVEVANSRGSVCVRTPSHNTVVEIVWESPWRQSTAAPIPVPLMARGPDGRNGPPAPCPVGAESQVGRGNVIPLRPSTKVKNVKEMEPNRKNATRFVVRKPANGPRGVHSENARSRVGRSANPQEQWCVTDVARTPHPAVAEPRVPALKPTSRRATKTSSAQ